MNSDIGKKPDATKEELEEQLKNVESSKQNLEHVVQTANESKSELELAKKKIEKELSEAVEENGELKLQLKSIELSKIELEKMVADAEETKLDVEKAKKKIEKELQDNVTNNKVRDDKQKEFDSQIKELNAKYNQMENELKENEKQGLIKYNELESKYEVLNREKIVLTKMISHIESKLQEKSDENERYGKTIKNLEEENKSVAEEFATHMQTQQKFQVALHDKLKNAEQICNNLEESIQAATDSQKLLLPVTFSVGVLTGLVIAFALLRH